MANTRMRPRNTSPRWTSGPLTAQVPDDQLRVARLEFSYVQSRLGRSACSADRLRLCTFSTFPTGWFSRTAPSHEDAELSLRKWWEAFTGARGCENTTTESVLWLRAEMEAVTQCAVAG